MRRKSRAQVALEYMMIFSFVLAALIPLIVLFYHRSSDIAIQVTSRQAQTVGQALVDRAESVYYLGEPSKATIRVYMPEGVEKVNLTNKAVVFTIRSPAGLSEIVIPTVVNLSGSVKKSAGIHFLTVESKGTYVQVNST